jgi:serine/threonine protein kinase
VLADEVSHLSTDTYGTVSYMAPELLGQGKFGKPADVYSFGVLSASNACCPAYAYLRDLQHCGT